MFIGKTPIKLIKEGGSSYVTQVILFHPLVALLVGIFAIAPTPARGTNGQVDSFIGDQLKQVDKANIFVKMASDANPDKAETMPDRNSRLNDVHNTLVNHATENQRDIRAFLDSKVFRYVSFWINNNLYIYDADHALVEALASRKDVAYLRGDRPVPLIRLVRITSDAPRPAAIEWGVQRINAPAVWAAGNTGEGTVVASIDTRVPYTHQAFVNQYRGINGDGTFTHSNNWWGPDGNYAQPTDTYGHGTHTIGTWSRL